MTRQGCRDKRKFLLFGARRQARAIGPPLAGAGSFFYLKLGLAVLERSWSSDETLVAPRPERNFTPSGVAIFYFYIF